MNKEGIKMGHLYPKNVSKWIIYKLFDNWVKYGNEKRTYSTGFLDEPKPLTRKEIVDHFMYKIKQMQYAIKTIKKDESLIFTEDIEMQEETIKTLKDLLYNCFVVGCAEGTNEREYKYMLNIAIDECLAIWKYHKFVYKNDKEEWFLDLNYMQKQEKQLEDLVIKYVDM